METMMMATMMAMDKMKYHMKFKQYTAPPALLPLPHAVEAIHTCSDHRDLSGGSDQRCMISALLRLARSAAADGGATCMRLAAIGSGLATDVTDVTGIAEGVVMVACFSRSAVPAIYV